MRNVVRLATCVAVVLTVVGVWMSLTAQFQHDDLPRGFTSPVLAMEMAHSMAEVKMIVGGPGHSDRSEMRNQQYMDFVFIAAYWLEFLLISLLLTRRRFRFARVLGVFTGLCVSLAALLDVRENLAILDVLSASPKPDNDPLVQMVRDAAIPKWILLFFAMVLLSFVFIGRRDWRTKRGVIFLSPGLCFFLTGTIGLISLGQDAMLEWIGIPMAVGLIALIIALSWSPSKLLQGL